MFRNLWMTTNSYAGRKDVFALYKGKRKPA